MKWTFPYDSRHMPVMAPNAVATSQPLAAQAGLRMLQAGGNAVDAALAAAIALTVVEPVNTGLGSDAFAIVWDGTALHGLNASGKSPAALNHDIFDGMKQMPGDGWETVTVPGAVSAWVTLSKKHGRLPFGQLFEPAVAYAEQGYNVSPLSAAAWTAQKSRLEKYPGWSATFLADGRAPRTGELFKSPDHAVSLKLIAESQGEEFYRGSLAEKIAAYARATGGYINEHDLSEHSCIPVDPICTGYGDLTVHEIPPNGQGLAALIALGILEQTEIDTYEPDSADSVHVQLEAMKLAFADAYRYIADPDALDINPENLLKKDYLVSRAALIDMNKAGEPVFGVPPASDTVYLAAADASGMMVSFIQSNFNGFGSGIVVPGTGIALQNRGCGFSLEKGHPNRVAGGKRPYHTIIPGFVTRAGKPLMAFGVMGGPVQPQGHTQVIVRMADQKLNPQAASDAPRWLTLGGRDIALEPGFLPGTETELEKRGHVIRKNPGQFFGGAQLIYRMKDGYCAGSDHRRDGQAVGF